MPRAARIGLWLLAVPLGLVAAVLALILLLNTDTGRRAAERSVYRLSAKQVQLVGLAGRFPDDLQLGSLQISDDNGRWLYAEGIVLKWSPMSVLRDDVLVQQLHVARLDLDRAPVSKSKSSGSHSLPRTIDMADVQVDRLNLGAPLAGTAATLQVHASARLRSLDDSSLDVDAQRLNGAGQYQVKFSVAGGHVSGTLALSEPAGGALANLAQLPGLGALQANASLGGPPGTETLQLQLAAGTLKATANGTLDWAHRSADLTVAAHSAAMAPRADVQWQRLDLDARWRGAVAAPEVTLTLALRDLQAAGASIAVTEASIRGEGGSAKLSARATRVRLPGSHPDLLGADPVTLDAELSLGAAHRLTYRLSHPLLEAQGDAVLATPLQVTAALKLPALAPLAALGGTDLKGSAQLRLRYEGDGNQGRIDATGNVAVVGGTAPIPQLAGQDAKLALKFSWSPQQLRIDAARIDGAAAQLSLEGERNASRGWALRWKAAVTDLAQLAAVVAGHAAATGTVDGNDSDLRASAVLTADASVHGSPTGEIVANITGHQLLTQPALQFELHGSLDSAPVQINASLARDGAGALHLQVPRGDWKSAHLNGELTWPAAKPAAKPVDRPAAGSVSKPALTTAKSVPRGQLQLHIARLADLHTLTGQDLAGELNATLESAAGTDDMKIQVEAKQVQYGAYSADLQLAAQGSTHALPLQLTATVSGVPDGDLQLSAAGTADLDQQLLRLEQLHAQYRGESAQLRNATQIHYGDSLTVTGLRLALQKAELAVDGQLSPRLDLRASLRNLNPGLIAKWAGKAGDQLPTEGQINGDATLQGSLSQPQGSVHLQAMALRWRSGAAEGLPPLDLAADVEMPAAKPAQLLVKMTSGSGTQLTVQGQLPLAAEATLALHVFGAMDMGLVNGFLEAGGRRVAGHLTVDGNVAGTVAAPEMNGALALRDGDVRDYTTGVHLAAVSADVQAQHDLLTLTKLTAKAGTGTVEGAGTLALLQPGMPVDLKVTAHDAQPVDSQLLSARLDAALQLSGKLREQLRLTGSATINRAEITVPSALPVAVATLDVRRPGTAAIERTADVPLTIDVSVSAPRAVFVRGRGLDAEVGGDLKWQGTRSEPQISGGFELRTGRFNLAGKTLEFESGRVSFNGQGVANQLDPTLDFVASNTSAGVTATLKITGYADAPVLTLESSPERPQDQVLAQLLFGADATQLSALQFAQMGAAVATLGGIGGGGSPLLSLQRGLGLDRLAISGGSGTESSGATLEAGRYVSQRVYVGTKQSTSGGTQAEVEVDVSKRLKVHTSFGAGAGSAQGATTTDTNGSTVGLSYELEF